MHTDVSRPSDFTFVQVPLVEEHRPEHNPLSEAHHASASDAGGEENGSLVKGEAEQRERL